MPQSRIEYQKMYNDSKIRLLDLVVCLSDAMDFIHPAVVSHHKQVAYIASRIGAEMGLPIPEQKRLILAAALHDIGAFSLKDRLDTLHFEVDSPHAHAERGYALLKLFSPLSDIAPIVRFHHLNWERGGRVNMPVPESSHILHLADRIAVLINKENEVLGQAPAICKKIREVSGSVFMPQAVDSFMILASKEYFWLDSVSHAVQSLFPRELKNLEIGLSSEDMVGFSRLFSKIIDYKSRFTATHSSGVAISAEMLSRFCGFNEVESRVMLIAGYLHDLGKLAVPLEILDKPSKLGKAEFNMVKHHTFYTYRILETIPAFRVANQWASFHHEHLDGSGYPFHLKAKEIQVGSRIMSVADTFTAITENRPYRAGMDEKHAIEVLDGMTRTSALDKKVLDVLKNNYDEINTARIRAQSSAEKDYRSLSTKPNSH